MTEEIFLESVKQRKVRCEERLDFYQKMAIEYPEDITWVALVERAKENIQRLEIEIARVTENS